MTGCPDGARLHPRHKCLLFVLADYHNTAHHAIWPAIPTLAEESLSSKRQVYTDMAYLEKHGVLVRLSGGGRGNTSVYQFTALDLAPELKGAPAAPFFLSSKGCGKGDETVQKRGPNKEKTEPEPEKANPPPYPPPLPGRGGGSPEAWAKRHAGKFRRFCAELRRAAEACVGNNDPGGQSERKRCLAAAVRTGVPQEIALSLCDLEEKE